MDRSFLSQPAVIEASRQFVCVRLTTYEDEFEAKFLKSLVRTRSGEVENSSFAILDVDGKTKLVGGERGMDREYRDAQAMADGMARLLAKYTPKGVPASLPLVPSVRLALPVAASDGHPLVVVRVKDEKARAELEKELAKLAWGEEFVGRFVFTEDADATSQFDGLKGTPVAVVVQSDTYGQKGKVLAQAEKADDLAAALRTGLKGFVKDDKETRTHISGGLKQGVFWDTKTPVTDPQEAAARERAKKK
jgi:hypothetical protein